MSDYRGWSIALFQGVAAAIVGSVLLSSIVLFFEPSGEPHLAPLRAVWLTWRLILYLAVFGALSGMLLRAWPRRSWVRFLIIAVLSLSASVASTIGLQAYQVRQWRSQFIEPQFAAGTHESEIRRVLGPPTNIDHEPFDGPSVCFGKPAHKTLTYAFPNSGPARSFHFSAEGTLICESLTWRHVWS